MIEKQIVGLRDKTTGDHCNNCAAPVYSVKFKEKPSGESVDGHDGWHYIKSCGTCGQRHPARVNETRQHRRKLARLGVK